MATYRSSAEELLLAFAWSAWGTLGLSSWEHHHDDWLLDPEVLALVGAIVGEADPRLREEVLDWCSRFAQLLSRTRMRSLLRLWAGTSASAVWGRFGAELSSLTGQRWPGAGAEVRSVRGTSGKSSVRSDVPAALGLRVRAAVGVSARAEVLTRFLANPDRSVTAADLAPVTVYTKRNVADALAALAIAGLVRRTGGRNGFRYRLVAAAPLTSLFGPLPGCAPVWGPLLSGLVTLVQRLAASEDWPPDSRSADAHGALRSVGPALQAAAVTLPEVPPRVDAWAAATSWSLQLLGALAAGDAPRFRTAAGTTDQ